jgi:hypothetical protein
LNVLFIAADDLNNRICPQQPWKKAAFTKVLARRAPAR